MPVRRSPALLNITLANRPQVEPNAGFVRQLQLFERMTFSIEGRTPAHTEYR